MCYLGFYIEVYTLSLTFRMCYSGESIFKMMKLRRKEFKTEKGGFIQIRNRKIEINMKIRCYFDEKHIEKLNKISKITNFFLFRLSLKIKITLKN